MYLRELTDNSCIYIYLPTLAKQIYLYQIIASLTNWPMNATVWWLKV